MDFGQFDARGAADKGAFCQLVHTHKFHKLEDDGKPVGFLVRGNASREAQEMLRQMRAAEMQVKKSGEDTEDAEEGFIEEMHRDAVESALVMVIEAQNIEVRDDAGKLVPVGRDRGLIRRVLDMSYPEIRTIRDKDGKPERDEEGKMKVDMVNKPFAIQVVEFAADQSNYLGKS